MDGPEGSWRKAGHTIGFLEEARFQGLAVDADNAKNKAAWDAKMDYHTWGGVVNFIPQFGDAAQRGVDVLTSQWLEDETSKIDDGLARDNRDSSIDRERRVEALANIWLQANPNHGDHETQAVVISRINGTVGDGRDTAHGLAGKGS